MGNSILEKDTVYNPYFDRVKAADYLGDYSPETLVVWNCAKRYNLNPQKLKMKAKLNINCNNIENT